MQRQENLSTYSLQTKKLTFLANKKQLASTEQYNSII